MKKIMIVGLFLVTSSLFAEGAAQVLFATQQVIAKKNGVARSLSRGASLNPGDAIITGQGSLVNIKYTNGTLVNIGENTNYTILAYAPNSPNEQIKAELKTGKIKLQTTGRVKESIKTPVIALAIIGTSIKLAVTGRIESTNDTIRIKKASVNLSVIEGAVQAGNTTISAGESVLINPNGDITEAPFPLSADVKEQPGAEGTISDSENSSTEGNKASSSNAAVEVTSALAVVETTQIVSAVQNDAFLPLADLAIQCGP